MQELLDAIKEQLKENIDLNGRENDGRQQEDMIKKQEEGIIIAKDILNRKSNFVIIADDVGLGKTYEALGLLYLHMIEKQHQKQNILIITPNQSLGEKWIKTYKDFLKDCVRNKDKRIPMNINNFLDNPLKLLKLQKGKTHNISIIRQNIFSYMNRKLLDWDKEEHNNLDKDKQKAIAKEIKKIRDFENENQVRQCLIRLNSFITKFDLVIIDESQNLRGEYATKNKNFNDFFGLNRKFEYDSEKLYEMRKEYNCKNKFEKVVFLSATPNHATPKDINRQIEYMVSKKKSEELTKDENFKRITNEKEYEKIDESVTRDKLYMIRRNRTFLGKSKYYFRNYESEIADMTLEEMLAMAVIQKRAIANNNSHFSMGYIDGFESFIETPQKNKKKKVNKQATTDVPDEVEDLEQEKNYENKPERNKKDEETDTFYISDLIKDLGKYNLTHPKIRKLKQDYEESFSDIEKSLDKNLIFVRRINSTTEISKTLMDEYTRQIDYLIMETLKYGAENIKRARKRTTEDITRELIKRIERGLNNTEEIKEYEDLIENKQYETDEENELETDKKENNWFRQFKKKTEKEKELERGTTKAEERKLYSLKQRFYKNKSFANIWEENILVELGCECKIVGPKILIDNNTQKVEIKIQDLASEVLKEAQKLVREQRLKLIIKDKKHLVGSTDLARIVNIILLKRLDLQKIENCYKNFYFPRNLKNKSFRAIKAISKRRIKLAVKQININKIKVKDIKTIIKNKKSLWNIEEFAGIKWPARINIGITEENFLTKEIIKNIIKRNLLIGEGMIYIATMCSMLKNTKPEEKCKELINNIEKDKSRFKIRIFKRIQRFIENFDNQTRKGLEISTDNYNINTEIPCWGYPIEGCSSRNEKTIKTIKRCFNTSFFPDVMITTDILKEGIDLQINCSNIIHYGIAWLPGDMEQRIGRIDRYFSKTYKDVENYMSNSMSNRRVLGAYIEDFERMELPKINIKFIYMKDTLDERQVAEILKRMITSIRFIDAKENEEAVIDESQKANTEFIDEYDNIKRNIHILNKIK